MSLVCSLVFVFRWKSWQASPEELSTTSEGSSIDLNS